MRKTAFRQSWLFGWKKVLQSMFKILYDSVALSILEVKERTITSSIEYLMNSIRFDKPNNFLACLQYGSTYYRYKSRIYKEAKKLWNLICIESLEYRALELKKSLELSVKVNEEIATDRHHSAQQRMVAGQLMANAQLNILKLLKEGPKYMKLDL